MAPNCCAAELTRDDRKKLYFNFDLKLMLIAWHPIVALQS
jgi:hypothetical protein